MQPIADDNVPGAWRPVCIVQSSTAVLFLQTLVDGAT